MNSEETRKKKRRSKKNVTVLDFQCGCGKAYLSYAALFTHLKNVHDKIAPEGTIIHSKKKDGIRGRPKKEGKKENSQIKSKEEETSSESDDIDTDLDELLYFLENFERLQKNFAFRVDSAEKNYDFVTYFPIELFQEEIDYLPIYDQLKAFQNNPKALTDFFKRKKGETKDIDSVFAVFLVKIAKILKSQFYREIAYFLCIYRKIMIELFKEEKKAISQIPIDFFMEKSEEPYDQLLFEISKQFQNKNQLFLGNNADNINLMRLFKLHLRNWLNRCKLTVVETDL